MKIQLTRLVRLALDPRSSRDPSWTNNWVGGPTVDRLVPRVELEITVRRPVSRRTGYIEDIAILDQCLKRHALQTVLNHTSQPPCAPAWLACVWQAVHEGKGDGDDVVELSLTVTPQWRYTIYKEAAEVLVLTRQFEFSAAHRLHSADLSEEENRQLYGKCNNPYGHGHNYLLDVGVASELNDTTPLSVEHMDQLVNEHVVSRLDHRFLNQEVEPFQELNPTVEQIAVTIWQWLDGVFSPHRLVRIRLYETAKTWVDILSDE